LSLLENELGPGELAGCKLNNCLIIVVSFLFESCIGNFQRFNKLAIANGFCVRHGTLHISVNEKAESALGSAKEGSCSFAKRAMGMRCWFAQLLLFTATRTLKVTAISMETDPVLPASSNRHCSLFFCQVRSFKEERTKFPDYTDLSQISNRIID